MDMSLIERVREIHPLIHCITNYVTARDVANIILAVGGSPIMADEPKEVEDVISLCGALVLNLGTLDERKLESMILAGKKANKLNLPVVLDPVGVGSSSFRTEAAHRILQEVKPDIIRGNASEIYTIAGKITDSYGVDAGTLTAVTEKNIDEGLAFLKHTSKVLKATIVMTGSIDLIAEENRWGIVRNGHPWMARITGTGCMLDGMIASYAACSQDIFAAAVTAVSVEGMCGELAYEKAKDLGTGSFQIMFTDAVSCITDQRWKEGARIEVR